MTTSTLDRAGVRVTACRVQDQAEQVARRFLQEAFRDALACQWRKYGDVLEWARPRPADFTGRATAADLAARDARLARGAELCRFHAGLIEAGTGADLLRELDDLLAEGVV